MESGKLVLEEAEFDFGRELEGLVDMFSVQCINHNVEIILDLSDDMPKLVRGDSARVVQIFANLINNSIKFTLSGHIILRGWYENPNSYGDSENFTLEQKQFGCSSKTKMKQHENHSKKTSNIDNKMILWFEVDDTGCGIDPSKWDSVFESFEQADLSTTRLHGGTGLGLCIVRSLVNKMGGDIKIVKKEGPGTLMRLYMRLTAPVDTTEQHCQVDFANNNLMVLLALHGNMSRLITSKWLQKNGVVTMEASEWNGLTQILKELFQAKTSTHNNDFDAHFPAPEGLNSKFISIQELTNPTFVIVVDIDLLDLSTDIWKEQLNFLHKYYARAKFVWLQNHDSSNTVKTELRKKGHILTVNKPLYKAKMIHILEDVIKERNVEVQKKNMKEDDLHESLEIEYTHHCDVASSDGSDISEIGSSNLVTANGDKQREEVVRINPSSLYQKSNCLLGLSNGYMEHKEAFISTRAKGEDSKGSETSRISGSSKAMNGKKSLEGLRILLAEDTAVIQRVATIMLEKMGATVVAVGDGQQAVDALNGMPGVERNTITSQTEILSFPSYDLILMDCQMPKMDGYEATKEIRKSEIGTSFHIPIVALTAHAMSCDEAKCLEVGMDAYLTKPIDFKLMESTILSLTKRETLSS